MTGAGTRKLAPGKHYVTEYVRAPPAGDRTVDALPDSYPAGGGLHRSRNTLLIAGEETHLFGTLTPVGVAGESSYGAQAMGLPE